MLVSRQLSCVIARDQAKNLLAELDSSDDELPGLVHQEPAHTSTGGEDDWLASNHNLPPARTGENPFIKKRQNLGAEQAAMDEDDDGAAHMDDDVDMNQDEGGANEDNQPQQKRSETRTRLFRASAAPSQAEATTMAPSVRRKLQQQAAQQAAPAASSSSNKPGDALAMDSSQGWWRDREAMAASPAAAPADLPKDLPVGSDGSLMVFWLDAYEDAKHSSGTVFLFGKVLVREPDQFASICVRVTNLERCMLVQLREETPDGRKVTPAMVYQELSGHMQKIIPAGKGRFGVKPVKRQYAFELSDVKREEDTYLKVVYPATFPTLPSNLSGDSFVRIFGTQTSCLEHFLLKRDLMGPSWIKIAAVQNVSAKLSWCQYEVLVSNPKAIKVANPGNGAPTIVPPLRVLSLSMKTVVNPQTHTNEVVLVSGLLHSNVNIDGPTPSKPGLISNFTVLRGPGNGLSLPPDMKTEMASASASVRQTVRVMPDERALLSWLIDQIARLDPDVLLGHNITGFDLDVLLFRVGSLKLPQWSRIGRLRRDIMPKASQGASGKATFRGVVAAGRLVCDTYVSARELVRETTYALTGLAKSQLKMDRVDVHPADVPGYYRKGGRAVLWLAQHTENDAYLALQLMFKLQILPLTKQLTNLAGNLWARSLKGARAERIEYLLLHEFHRLKYVVPDKEFSKGGSGASGQAGRKRPKAAYAGGLVLEPKKGLYDKFVLLLDFNSLYPSIIQEYNICFTTVERFPAGTVAGGPRRLPLEDDSTAIPGDGPAAEEVEGEDASASLPPLPAATTAPGILPRVIRTLVQRRRQVKNMMKSESDPVVKNQLDIRQLALKILANSMYGCLGFGSSRFYAQQIAALITSQGREILQNTVEVAEQKLGLNVIYGDTDSIMINTGLTDLKRVKAIGVQVKKEVNKLYKLLELEVRLQETVCAAAASAECHRGKCDSVCPSKRVAHEGLCCGVCVAWLLRLTVSSR